MTSLCTCLKASGQSQAGGTNRAVTLKAQEQVDANRDAIAAGGVTVDDLEAMDAELLEIMPDTARVHAGIEPRAATPDLLAQFKESTVTPPTQVQTVHVSGATPLAFQ